MSLYGALSKHNHLSEFNEHLNDRGNVKTPTQRRHEAIANLFTDAKLATEAGSGVTAGSGVVYKSSVVRIGDIINTRIIIDLTGLTSADSDLDVIGVEDTANPCHIGQITAARNGTVFGGRAICLEVPSSLTDIDLYSAGAANLVYEDLITDESDEVALITAGGAWTAGLTRILTGIPPADSYLYLVNGAADTPDAFTAGKFLIELEGYAA